MGPAASSIAQMEAVVNRAPNVGTMFLNRVEASGPKEAFRYPAGDGEWHSITWAETGVQVAALAAGLVELGLKPEERVAIAASTRIEWVLADLAINCAAGATTTVYPATGVEDVTYILSDSDARIVIVEDLDQYAKLDPARLTRVNKVVIIDGESEDSWAMTLGELAELGVHHLATTDPGAVDRRASLPEAGQLATLIYTSGTTGRPKGVRLTHDVWTYEGATLAAKQMWSEDDLEFRWVPMAHAFGKILLALQLAVGYPAAIDGDVTRIMTNLATVKPTFMAAVPRIYEKIHATFVSRFLQGGNPTQSRAIQDDIKAALKASRLRRRGLPVPKELASAVETADESIFTPIRDQFGGRIRFFISGSAALSQEVAEWFHVIGVLIIEGYGLTETAAGTFLNDLHDFKLGTVGRPVIGTQVRIADDGEVLIKGPGVMQGYHNLPAETEAVFVEDGWFASGDIGHLDEDGFLHLTDRKKDLFKTSGGKYVAPTHVEGMFKAICPVASQIVVHGEGRQYCTAIITLDSDTITGWAASNGLAHLSYQELAASDEVHELISSYVGVLNDKLNSWETVKKFVILDRDFSIDDGEITPSMKLKRRSVVENHRDLLDSLYES